MVNVGICVIKGTKLGSIEWGRISFEWPVSISGPETI
jgi:hypothetical protein